MGSRRGSASARGTRRQDQGRRRFGGGAVDFVRGVRNELRKVSWPDREQLRQSTSVVLIIVVTLGVYVAAWDFVFRTLSRIVFLP